MASGSGPLRVLLLYGKPLTRIAALRTTAVSVAPDGQATLQLGRGEIALPEPLGAIALAIRYQHLERAAADGWLLPGRHAGTHITADTLRGRLKRYRIGIHQARAAQWVRLAGSTYVDYVAVRNRNERGAV